MAGARARCRRLLAARARPGRRGGDRRYGRDHARGAGCLGGAARRHARARPARHHLARPAPPRLDRAQAGALDTAERKPSHVERLLSRLSRRRRASSPSPTRRPPRLSWLGGVLGQRVARSASKDSARPATSPTSTPPTGSTPTRSPKRLPSFCCLLREQQWPGVISTSGRSATRVAHAITRTVTETDNLLITTLTHNPQPLHLDYEAAAKTEFGKPLVNSCFTFSLLIGVSVHDTTLGTLVANLGYDQLKFPESRFRRRHSSLRDRMSGAPRKQVATECWHRHLGAPQLQSAQ